MSKRVCAYPGCDTVLSIHNDGTCCRLHDTWDRMIRAGKVLASVPEEEQNAKPKVRKTRSRSK